MKSIISLGIPYFRQEGSLSCGLVVLRMALGYYKEEVTESDLKRLIKLHSFGSFSTELGTLAINKGYKVTSYTFHLPLLGPLKPKFGIEIDTNFLRRIKPRQSDKLTFKSWKKYLEKGGKLIWEYPKIKLLEYWLNKKAVCIINVNTAALNNYWRNWDNGHFLTIDGMDNENVIVLDPNPDSGKTRYPISKELLLPAWSINAKRSSAYLMVIEKSKI